MSLGATNGPVNYNTLRYTLCLKPQLSLGACYLSYLCIHNKLPIKLAAFCDTSTYLANGTYPELKCMSRFVWKLYKLVYLTYPLRVWWCPPVHPGAAQAAL